MKPRPAPVRNQRVSSRKQRKQQHLLDVSVRSRAARRYRDRRALALLSAIFLFCAAAGGLWYGGRAALRRYFWQNPDYNLTEVDFSTDGSLTRQQVLDAANIQEGKNIFAVNLSAARSGVLALPQVDRADLERIMPNKISIDITERKPVAWVTGSENGDPTTDPGAFLIDHDGTLMRIKEQVPAYYHLPVICGLPVDNYEAGQTVDLPEVRAALELIRLTGENPARYQVRSIDVSKGYCLLVTDERHAKVMFPLDNIQSQLDRLGLLLASCDSENREIQTVNLLVQRNIPVTFVPPPSDTPDDSAAGTLPYPDDPQATTEETDAPAPIVAATPAPKHGQGSHKSSSSLIHHQAITVRRAIPLATPENE